MNCPVKSNDLLQVNMSYAYIKVVPVEKPSKLYGFEKVPSNRLPGIIARLQKTTHGASCCPSSSRTSHGLCERAKDGLPPASSGKRMSDRDLTKLVRRLRTPTISKLAATGLLNPDYESKLRSETPLRFGTDQQRPKTAIEFRKFLKRIGKSTTSSRGKTFDPVERAADIGRLTTVEFHNEEMVTKHAAESIFERVQQPTIASQPQHPDCPKRPATTKCLSQEQRRQLPLVSGLPRSTNVNQIVGRLYNKRPITS
jgi:hypothetical protein